MQETCLTQLPHVLSDICCKCVRPAYLAPGLQAPWRLLRQLPARVTGCLSRSSFRFRFQIQDYSRQFSCALTPFKGVPLIPLILGVMMQNMIICRKTQKSKYCKGCVCLCRCCFHQLPLFIRILVNIRFTRLSELSNLLCSWRVTCRSSSAPVRTALSTLQRLELCSCCLLAEQCRAWILRKASSRSSSAPLTT